MYLTQCVTDPSSPRYAKIVTSPRSDAAWGKTNKLEITKDTLSSYAHPAISPDGEWLYFVSDMPGGMGGLDIWRVLCLLPLVCSIFPCHPSLRQATKCFLPSARMATSTSVATGM